MGGRRAWSAVGVRMFCIQVEMVDDHGLGELQKKFTHKTSYMYQTYSLFGCNCTPPSHTPFPIGILKFIYIPALIVLYMCFYTPSPNPTV